jgi:ABC-type phosphate transport system substrate-binding protein
MKPMKVANIVCLAASVLFGSASGYPPTAPQRADALIMVANKNNSAAAKMNKNDIKRLLLGQTTTWPDGGRVAIVLENVGSPERALVLQKVCGMNEAEFTRHNLQASFMGDNVAYVIPAASSAAIRSLIKSNPSAVGFLRPGDLDENVKPVWQVD